MDLAEPPIDSLYEASLFLDFDGTLVELASRPDGVEVGEDLLNLLLELQQKLGGRIALLSGRAVDNVGRLLSPIQLAMGGSHGLERIVPGRESTIAQRPIGLDQVIEALRQLEIDHPGVLVEEKPASVAVHYRRAPGAADSCLAEAERAAAAIGMTIQQGKMVVELKPAGADKGTALRSFMSEKPFAGTRPIFIGDDLTDEHGFVAVRELGGAGVLVGPERATAASYRLEDVQAVRTWLSAACRALP